MEGIMKHKKVLLWFSILAVGFVIGLFAQNLTIIHTEAAAKKMRFPSGTTLQMDSGSVGTFSGTTTIGTLALTTGNITTLNATTGNIPTLNVGASGSVGTFKLYPATASKGYLALTCTNQTGDTAVTIDADAMGQATVFNLGDPGAAAVYLAASTLQLTLAEMDTLDGITSTTAELNILDGVVKTAAEVNEVYVNVNIPDISSAQSVWVVSPIAGNITKIYTVIYGAITVGDATVTAEIGGTLVTDSSITIANAGSAAGVVDSSTPSAANSITAGGAIEIITDGGSTDAQIVTVTIVITAT
jgi:hypothetical protein